MSKIVDTYAAAAARSAERLRKARLRDCEIRRSALVRQQTRLDERLSVLTADLALLRDAVRVIDNEIAELGPDRTEVSA